MRNKVSRFVVSHSLSYSDMASIGTHESVNSIVAGQLRSHDGSVTQLMVRTYIGQSRSAAWRCPSQQPRRPHQFIAAATCDRATHDDAPETATVASPAGGKAALAAVEQMARRPRSVLIHRYRLLPRNGGGPVNIRQRSRRLRFR